jgi:hypothetical protein
VRRVGCLSLALACLAASGQNGPALPTPLVPRLDAYIGSSVKLSDDERRRLMSGAPVTRLLEVADESKDVAVFGAVWIDAPMRRYVEAVKDIERFERGGGFKKTRRISDPPRPEDFAELTLPAEDLHDLRACRVGDCEIKLGEAAVERFRTGIDWSAPGAAEAVHRSMRGVALEYATAYLEGGNARLPVYRDKSRPRSVAEEFRAMVDEMPELTRFLPEMRRYLLEYPVVTLPGSTSFLYWQETEFGLKPTIRISHLTIREASEETVVASKMLYASHYFWTGLELRALLPDAARGPGFWFVTVSRSRCDGLSGFTGLFVRRRVRSAVRDGALAGLQRTKRRLEGSHTGGATEAVPPPPFTMRRPG